MSTERSHMLKQSFQLQVCVSMCDSDTKGLRSSFFPVSHDGLLNQGPRSPFNKINFFFALRLYFSFSNTITIFQFSCYTLYIYIYCYTQYYYSFWIYALYTLMLKYCMQFSFYNSLYCCYFELTRYIRICSFNDVGLWRKCIGFSSVLLDYAIHCLPTVSEVIGAKVPVLGKYSFVVLWS